MSNPRESISLNVNGSNYDIDVEPRRSLADALREDCHLTGTRLGCEHGVCGACTVLMNDDPVRACLVLAVQAQGQAVRTVEGLSVGSEPLHPVQQAFWEHHALQCGFCTAGFLMLATSIVESDNVPTDQELTDVLASNLCRCTGYQNIKKAVCSAIEATRK